MHGGQPLGAERSGVLAAGHFIVDRLVLIDRYPPENTLALIEGETVSSGGCPFTVLKDLALFGATFGLAAIGALGSDRDAQWIRAECAAHGIDTRGLTQIDGATTSYTYAMTVRATGRRTFFHQSGANALLAPEHFDFTASNARIFVLGYLTLLESLDVWAASGVTAAAQVLARARTAGLTTVVDLVSAPNPDYRAIVWSALPHIDHLLLNECEAALLLSRPVDAQPGDLLSAAHEIAAGGVGRSVMIHCEDGIVGLDCETGQHVVQGAVALPRAFVAGATGAGDALTAGYVWALHAGEPLAARLTTGVCAAAACLGDASASGGIRSMPACLELGERFGFRPFPAPAQVTR
ncbi:MAG: carbohydrate kinase family protein [Candidatus Velthaea sp.]